jgi:hypothetical protein
LVLRSSHDQEAQVSELLSKCSKSEVGFATRLDEKNTKSIMEADGCEDAAANSQYQRCVVIVVVRHVLCLVRNGEEGR